MVKHVILWTLKNEYSKEEKEAIKAEIKAGLEGLAGQIPGLLEIHVNINGLESSNADLILDSTFTDEAALKGYSVHPAHVAVANGKVRPHTAIRSCLDFRFYSIIKKLGSILSFAFELFSLIMQEPFRVPRMLP